jgi:hypothetical protein
MKYQPQFRSPAQRNITAENLEMRPSVMSYVEVNCSAGREMRHLHVASPAGASKGPLFRAQSHIKSDGKARERREPELRLNGVEIARKIASIAASFYYHPLSRLISTLRGAPLYESDAVQSRNNGGRKSFHFDRRTETD